MQSHPSTNARIARYREEGRCCQAGCPQWPAPGFKSCQHHLDYRRAQRANLPKKKWVQPEWDGTTCFHHSCKNPSAPGRRLCADHLKYQSDYRKGNLDKYRSANLASNMRIKQQAMAAYGGCCAVCGESDPVVLQLDHINGRQEEGRKKTGVNELRRLRALGFPQGNYQFLCANCHARKTYQQFGYQVSLPDGV